MAAMVSVDIHGIYDVRSCPFEGLGMTGLLLFYTVHPLGIFLLSWMMHHLLGVNQPSSGLSGLQREMSRAG